MSDQLASLDAGMFTENKKRKNHENTDDTYVEGPSTNQRQEEEHVMIQQEEALQAERKQETSLKPLTTSRRSLITLPTSGPFLPGYVLAWQPLPLVLSWNALGWSCANW